ncbi:hypothetical protein L611_001300000760 [Aminobacter sp. J15]|nr:hypothetical protein L611_001300000760 [Aminobacter sp. J15]
MSMGKSAKAWPGGARIASRGRYYLQISSVRFISTRGVLRTVRRVTLMNDLIGVGLYTPAEASRLLHIPASRIFRWLRGHEAAGKQYEPLWDPEVTLDDGRLVLGFRDLMEARVADAFIRQGVSAIRVRAAIKLAREIIKQSHPLSTNRFLTEGREIFLHVIEEDDDGNQTERLLNLFKRQYEFKGVLEPILKTVDFGADGLPKMWWPAGRQVNIVVDPERSFGAPIDGETSIPTAVLASAVRLMGEVDAAKAYEAPISAVRRALEFEERLEQRLAA